MSHAGLWESVPGRGNSQCKGAEAKRCLKKRPVWLKQGEGGEVGDDVAGVKQGGQIV